MPLGEGLVAWGRDWGLEPSSSPSGNKRGKTTQYVWHLASQVSKGTHKHQAPEASVATAGSGASLDLHPGSGPHSGVVV